MEGQAECKDCPVSMKHGRGLNLAGQQAVYDVLQDLMAVLFPGCHGTEIVSRTGLKVCISKHLKGAAKKLRDQAERAFKYECVKEKCGKCGHCGRKADEAVAHLLEALPGIEGKIRRDIVAAYEGDPAARSTMEVVMSYPGLNAIVAHRIAHVLYEQHVPLIPRMMSEYAHSRTGIDIHPGAQIGPGFFIDHGTGVVIGETCVIGANVKIYQGVTLGALSFQKDKKGRLIKGIKRHPNVEDNVVIYSGATILGNVTIGRNSVIGGNVWLTHSIPPDSTVYNLQPKPLIKQIKS
jgi:serine O-acetyltransferase